MNVQRPELEGNLYPHRIFSLAIGIWTDSGISLASLAEEHFTQASVEASGQPFCRWMKKLWSSPCLKI